MRSSFRRWGDFLLAALILLLAGEAVPPPKTVNDQVLGKAEDFMQRGPGRVCLAQTSVDLDEGETAYVGYLGIHYASLRIYGRFGQFSVTEGEMYKSPKGGQRVDLPGGDSVLRHRKDGRIRYLLFGPGWDANDDDIPRTWVEGEALGRGHDYNIFSRIRIAREPSKCTRRFEYGWDFLLGSS
jgi:hypothetical protein